MISLLPHTIKRLYNGFMKKEVIIAILVGLSMGMIITFGVYRVKNSVTDTPITNLEEDPSNEEATSAPTILALHNPEDGSVLTQKELTVTGETTPNSFIVLFVNDEDFVSDTDESGNFSFKVELEDGVNVLRVHVLNEDGDTTVEERLVVVSDAFEQAELEAQEAENAEEDEEASKSADASETNEGEL